MNNDTKSSYQEAFDFLAKTVQTRPKIGVVCGSGLGGFADTLSDVARFDYKDIPHCPVSTVEGHKVSRPKIYFFSKFFENFANLNIVYNSLKISTR